MDSIFSGNYSVVKRDKNKIKPQEDNRYSFRKRSKDNEYDKRFLGLQSLDGSDSDDLVDSDGKCERKIPGNAFVEENGDFAGSDVFVFKTPKRKDQMLSKASASAQKSNVGPVNEKTVDDETNTFNKGMSNNKPSTIKTRQKQLKYSEMDTSLDDSETTESSSEESMDENNSTNSDDSMKSDGCDTGDDEDQCSKRDIKKTPRSASMRTKRRLAKRTDINISSNESDSTGSSSEESDDDKDANKKHNTRDVIENYFLSHGSSKITTSDHTLASLDKPKLDHETLRSKLKDVPKSHAKQICKLNEKYVGLFDRWESFIEKGFNILLHGFGSKVGILNKFHDERLSNFDTVVVHGYFPNLSAAGILNSICEDLIGWSKKKYATIVEQAHFIGKHYSNLKKSSSNKLFIVAHNIDGNALHSKEDHYALSILVSYSNIHMIGSVDKINFGLLWDNRCYYLYSWLWYEVTNYEPYFKETSYENSLLVEQTNQLPLNSLLHVINSLTPNAQGIFTILARYQLDNMDSAHYTGLSFQDYYQRCREAFLVNSDLTLRAQLTEFKDHMLIKFKKGADGVEHLKIPLGKITLTEFIRFRD